MIHNAKQSNKKNRTGNNANDDDKGNASNIDFHYIIHGKQLNHK